MKPDKLLKRKEMKQKIAPRNVAPERSCSGNKGTQRSEITCHKNIMKSRVTPTKAEKSKVQDNGKEDWDTQNYKTLNRFYRVTVLINNIEVLMTVTETWNLSIQKTGIQICK